MLCICLCFFFYLFEHLDHLFLSSSPTASSASVSQRSDFGEPGVLKETAVELLGSISRDVSLGMFWGLCSSSIYSAYLKVFLESNLQQHSREEKVSGSHVDDTDKPDVYWHTVKAN